MVFVPCVSPFIKKKRWDCEDEEDDTLETSDEEYDGDEE